MPSGGIAGPTTGVTACGAASCTVGAVAEGIIEGAEDGLQRCSSFDIALPLDLRTIIQVTGINAKIATMTHNQTFW